MHVLAEKFSKRGVITSRLQDSPPTAHSLRLQDVSLNGDGEAPKITKGYLVTQQEKRAG